LIRVDPEKMYDVDGLAELFEVTKETIFRWNVSGDAPQRIKIGRKVFYKGSSVIAWINAKESV
jgi:predicted DNA-binding transcriptional regulator AlpA